MTAYVVKSSFPLLRQAGQPLAGRQYAISAKGHGWAGRVTDYGRGRHRLTVAFRSLLVAQRWARESLRMGDKLC